MIRPWYDSHAVAEVAHQMALLPLAWLLVRRRTVDRAWWRLALAFGISWLADWPLDLWPGVAEWVPSLVYLISQTVVIAAVLLPRRAMAMVLLVYLAIVGTFTALAFGVSAPDAVFHAVAWTSIVVIVLMRPDLPVRLRVALLVSFGVRLLTWLARVKWPILPTWYVDQGVRLVGLVLFCWASTAPGLHLVRVNE